MKNKNISRWLKIFLLALMSVYLGWVVVQSLDYSPPENHSFRFSNELIGIFHVHSHFSDGKKNLNFIADTAARSGADFLVLTDHGNPNLESQRASGIKSGVLILGGSELSLNRGHLVALAIQPPFLPLSNNAEEAAFQINQRHGFSIIAHPYSKTRWSWGKNNQYSGMEIINADSLFKSSFPGIIPYLPFLLFKPEITALKMLHSPRANLMKWDDVNRRRPFYGYYATDAHMFYKTLFSLLRLHVPLDKEAASDYQTVTDQIYSALSQGHFYNGIDGAANTSGFRFWGESKNQRIPMGSSAKWMPGTMLHLQLPPVQSCHVRMIHNGSLVPLESGKHIQFRVEKPGFYRVEVYLEHTFLAETCPWILSNPIFFKEE
jgi:hypothetical protein